MPFINYYSNCFLSLEFPSSATFSTCTFKFHCKSHLLREDIPNTLSQNEIQPSLNSHSICVDPWYTLDFFQYSSLCSHLMLVQILTLVVKVFYPHGISYYWSETDSKMCNFHSDHSSECPTKTCSLTCMRHTGRQFYNLLSHSSCIPKSPLTHVSFLSFTSNGYPSLVNYLANGSNFFILRVRAPCQTLFVFCLNYCTRLLASSLFLASLFLFWLSLIARIISLKQQCDQH